MEQLNRRLLFFLLGGLLGSALLPGQVPPNPPAAQEITVDALAGELGLHFSWDPYRETGVLSSPDRRAAFSPGDPFLVVDSRQILPLSSPRRGAEGMIYFSPSAAARIRALFKPPASPSPPFPGAPTDSAAAGLASAGIFRPGPVAGAVRPAEGPSIAAVILDPGHGGRDPGAVGSFTIDGVPRRFNEKDFTLDLARRLAALLRQNHPGRQIILTRTEDLYLTLEERTTIANSVVLEENEAMIFVSIHANASLNGSASGYEVWYLPQNFRRNLLSPGDMNGVEDSVIPILNHMLEEEFTRESMSLARSVSQGLETALEGRSLNRGLKEESWFVVRNAKMPSILIEAGFITNQGEALRMQESDYLQDMAQGIYNGINAFIRDFESTKGYTE
ncbi:MAG: N-acetylmuramoyl-L-alanine amidase [Spirochaetales bacterium]|jgi:N-acetylmuramoyl-L-alanine amidase|nr:N-acetylmuramoyl-L-alanine amidase [Spirochaetales bacterium]